MASTSGTTAVHDATTPLKATENPSKWGSIQDVVNAPLIDVKGDETWIAVIGMWLFLPLNLLLALPVACFKCIYHLVSMGRCCLVGVYTSVICGRPLILAWTWWLATLGGLTILISQHHCRLAMFLWEKAAMGNTGYFWQGAGFWTYPYEKVNAILKSSQVRHKAFACINACVPDLYAENLLIFLPNDGPGSEWWAVRNALHQHFLNAGLPAYRSRVQGLKDQLAKDWKDPKVSDLTNVDLMQKLVSKCIFYVMFGVWLPDEDAQVLSQWRGLAFWFILPRLIQRLLFNLGINKVKKLRIDTVAIIEKYGLQEQFVTLNESLGKYKRESVVKLCDEIMYVVGFAGIGGTSAAVDAVGAFLQVTLPSESPGKENVDFGKYDTSAKMVAKYKENPEKYIRETVRLVPPVTSATSSLKEDVTVPMNGTEYHMPKGTLNQYVIAIANRDESVFKQPSTFNPDRAELNQAVTWNGAFGSGHDDSYPRICPGRYLSLDVVTIIINHGLGHSSVLHASGSPP